MLNEKAGKFNFWLMVIGFNLTFFPMHFLGFEGQPRRTYTYPTGMGWDALNLLATIGAFIIALSVLIFLVNVDHSFRQPGRRARRPVGRAHARVDDAVAAARVQLRGRARWSRTSTSSGTASTPRTTRAVSCSCRPAPRTTRMRNPEVDPRTIHMPSPSYWPMVFALALPIIGYGFVFKNWWLLGARRVRRVLRRQRLGHRTGDRARGRAA